MSSSAQLAHSDFARFAGEASGSLYFDQLLRDGFSAWPATMQGRFSGLACWRGIARLKQQIREHTDSTRAAPVFVANRSAELMRLTSRLMCLRCRHVLTTNLAWPNYQRILETQARRTGTRVTCLNLRRAILRGGISDQDVIARIGTAFDRGACDGAFLPIVDNLGLRLPVNRIAERLRANGKLNFLALDGAQALAHVPIALDGIRCDILLTSCHKWLRAYNPLGIAVLANPATSEEIRSNTIQSVKRRIIDDALLRMTLELEHGPLSRYGETVNLLPLFTCSGALQDGPRNRLAIARELSDRRKNVDRLRDIVCQQEWKFLDPVMEMRSGICLLRARNPALTRVDSEELRYWFHDLGIAVTTYPRGRVRLSMPTEPWTSTQRRILADAFRRSPVPA